MAKEIRWSSRADNDRQEIEDYWTNRNKSNRYSIELDDSFRDAVNLLSKTPEIGKPTKYSFVRTIIVRDYLIYYRLSDTCIELITIWDSRRDPKKFKL